MIRISSAWCLIAVALGGYPSAYGANLLLNGDFESPPVLGVGQTAVAIGEQKQIRTDPLGPGYSGAISGIDDWTYGTPEDGGVASDHGIARHNALFGRPAEGQSAYINNWNRMVSQTVSPTIGPGYTATASIDFGTLGDDNDNGRAGVFYLVAGEADPLNPDQFSAGSIILDQLVVANPSWGLSTPDVIVGNFEYLTLDLSYTYGLGDPALNQPLTVAFRTVTFSVGATYWDDATLEVVPEPSSLALAALGLPLILLAARRRCARSGTLAPLFGGER